MKLQKKHIALIVVVIVAIAVFVYYKYFMFPEIPTETKEYEIKKINDAVTTNNTTALQPFPLKIGSKGEQVKAVQSAINKIYPNAKLTVDGSFGQKTYEALITFVGTMYYPVTTNNYIALLKK